MKRPASSASVTESLAAGFLAGLLAGLIFLGAGLARHGADLFDTAPSTSFALWVLLRSVALYPLLFGSAGVILGGVVHGVGRQVGRPGQLTFSIVLGVLVALVVFAYVSSWWQLEVLAGLPLGDAERLRGAVRHGGWALAVGVALVGVGAAGGALRRGDRVPVPTVRRALTGAVACLLLLAAAGVGLRRGEPRSGGAYQPSQVVVVGLDALTFRILSPMVRAGELPTFRRLIDEGAWGTCLTYGQASSPMVWTSMATGKRVRDHGITDFVTNRRASGADPLKSYDRRARAVWNILSDFDQRVALVDWLVTFPPEEVNGYVVSRLHVDEESRTHPAELNATIDAIVAERQDYGDPERTRNLSRIDHVFEIAHELLGREHIDYLALFEGVSDWVEHRYWKYYQPELFDPELWAYADADVDRVGTLIPETYAHLDRRLGELMARLDDDALLIVVSDHGQRPVENRQVWMQLDRILEALGYSELLAGGRKPVVDQERSRAYAAVETPWASMIGVNLNLRGREPHGIVDAAGSGAMVAELVTLLRDVHFEDGTPVFGAVYATGGVSDPGVAASQADIVVSHSRYTRSERRGRETVLVGGRRYRLEDFMEVNSNISGGHDHQGVIFMHGKGVRPGPIGQLVVSTALQEMVWHLTDEIDLVDRLLPIMRRLGLIERATTLDLAPTVLYTFGLPVGADMAGRALIDVIETGEQLETLASYETEETRVIRSVEARSDKDVMKRLEALGYIN